MVEAPRVLKLWTRPAEGGAMVQQESLVVEAFKGICGDHAYGRMRHVTLLFEDDWNAAAAELGVDVDPAGRRANVLLSGGDAGRLLKQRVYLGDVEIEIKGETAPCPVMEQAAPGMQEALKPATRAGVWGRVLRGGRIPVGAVLKIEEAPAG
jgi:MOSC domain-containing protein YiiM